MMKKLNLSRTGGRLVAALLLLFSLGIGNAWGGTDYYYARLKGNVANTGGGKVYVATSNTRPSSYTAGTFVEGAKTNTTKKAQQSFFAWAVADDGYAFSSWAGTKATNNNNSAISPTSSSSAEQEFKCNAANGTSNGSSRTSGSSSGDDTYSYYDYTATATFVAVQVNSVSETSHTFSNLTNAQTTCSDYKKTITFTTTYADEMADFNVSLAKTAGDGVFSLDGAPSIANNTVTATVKFTGNDRYAATPGGARTNTATLTLTSKGSASQTKKCTFTATFPSASVTSGKLTVSGAESDLYATNTNPVNGNVEFAVMYADALGDFTLPTAVTEKSHAGDTWTIGTAVGPNTNYETGAGKIVIPITFTSEEGEYGDHTAQITLGGVTVTMTAHVEELADYDVKVIDADGTTELYKGAWADAAFTALNGHEGSTLIVGRDFNIGSVSSARAISQNVTLDLNGKAVTATLTAAGSLLSVTSGKTLTIGGVKGGSLSVTGNVAGRIAIVEVQNGSLNLQRGDLEITNSNSGSGTESDPYAAGVYLASRAWSEGKPTVTMAMSGGSITAKRTAGGHGYGICCAGSGNSASSIDLTGGTITAEVPNGTYALGVYVSGHSNISNMTINASSSTNPYAIFTGASDAKVVISSGTYSSVSTGANPRALLTRGNVSVLGGTFTTSGTTGAYGLYVSNGTAVINAGSFSATATAGVAYGLGLPDEGAHTAKINGGSFSATGTTAAYAANTTANKTLITTAGTFTATASGENTDVKAYGLNLVANATANVAGATFSGITSGNAAVAGTNGNSQPKGAYGIFNLGNLTVTDCTLEGQSAKTYAYGLYTTQSVTMTGTSLSAETSGANGADHATALYINGSDKTVTANDCSFSAVANTTYAYGVYAYAGILESNNSNYFAETKQTGASSAAGCLSRGIYNNSGTTVTLNGGEISCIGNASYSQNAYGIYTAGTATITDATISCTGVNTGYALYVEGANATMTVNSGMFKGTSSSLKISSPKKIELFGGFYSHNTNLKTYKATGCEVYDTPDGSVEKEQGYNFKVADGSNPGVVVAKVYNSSSTLLQSYNTLVEALQFVNANSGTQYTIVMVGDYVLPAGDYTVPPQTALVIPDANTRTKPQGTKPNRVSITTPAPTPFRKLTLVDGTHLVVYGTIETTANQNTSAGGSPLSGAPTGPYGYIQMNAGSTISMESGSNLNSWGYIIGKGEITAQKGSTIREQFQMGYWRGGTATSNMVSNRNSWHAFPVMDYFYQNIEAPITYRPGATAYGYSKVHQSYDWVANDIKLLGTSEAMFLMDNDASEDNTWVRKEYNPATDRVEWTMNSGAKLGNFKFTMANQNINSADYYLPITNNMTITIKDGDCTITQDVILVPGAQLNINKTAKLKVSSGKKLFVVDTEDWKKCGNSYYYKANYSPSWTNPNSNPRTATQMPDAEIFVHGETEGSYYTSTHGANIHSTNEDAGKVKFIAAAGAATSIQQITSTNCDRSQVDFTTAQLKNEKEVNGSYYTSTVGTEAGYAYIYEDQQWVNVLDGCLTTRTDGSGTHYYARPGDNVAVLENDDDAAYHGEQAKDANRNFIFTEKSMTATDAANCVWWEAEKIGDIDGDGKIYYMANKDKYENYGAYYYYKSDVGYWVPRYVSITWSYQVDGSAKSVTYNSVYYHTSPVFAEFANPHKKDDATYSYAWTGWTDEDGLFYAKDGVLPLATKNTTYTAVFEATRLQGSVSFKNYNGGALESRLFDSETIPTCSLTPTRSADVESVYTFDGWSTSAGGNKAYEINGLPAVVKNTSVTYYAHFSASPRPYVITFANYNGDAIQNTEFGYNSYPTYNGADPTRANSGFWSYNFIGWVDKDEVFYAKGAELPVVKGVATYTAEFEAVDWTPEYTITFKDGDNKVLTTQTARLNAVPEYAGVTPTKTATAQYTYTFNNTWSPAIVAATQAATYTAQFDSELRSYTITFCNETGRELTSATFDYGATPVYGGETPKKARVGSTIYTFDGWSSTLGGTKLAELPTVIGAATYYAHFSDEPVYVVRFNAQGHGTAPANQEVIRGNKVVVPDVLIESGYIFGGWYKEVGCTTAWDFANDVVSADVTLYAKWTLKTYAITYNKGANGTGAIAAGEKTHGAAFTLSSDKFTRTGYTQTGWSTEDGGAKTYDLGGSYTANAAITLYPVWTINTHSLTWDANGGELSGTYTSGTAIAYGTAIDVPTVSRANFVFNGWDATPASTMPDNDLTYTAQWTPAEASVTAGGNTTYYTTLPAAFTAAKGKTNPTIKLLQDVALGASSVTYDGANTCTLDLNGHTVSGTNNRLLTINNASANFTITDNSEGKLGTLSMNTSSTDGAAFCVLVENGKLYLEAGTIYLYSNSTGSNAVAVRVNANGTFTMNEGTVHVKMTQSGRVGYSTQALGAITVNGGEFCAESANGEAYAMYVTGTMTVNGGKFHVTGATALISHSVSTADKLLIKGGYYNTNSSIATFVAPDKSTWNYYLFNTTAAEKAEVGNDYNYKVAEAYKVSWDATTNGGTCATSSTLVQKGTAIGTLPEATKTGYDFTGWFTTYTTGGNQVTAATVINFATTAYARFAPSTYDITYKDKDNAEFSGVHGSGYPTTHTYGTATTLVEPTREGYTFDGWYANAACTGSALTEIGATAYTVDFTLYAKWTVNMYTFTWLNWNGDPLGNPTITSTIHHGGQPAYNTLDPTPTRETSNGRTYAWDGWTTEAYGAGTFYAKDNLPKASGDATYYAHFRITDIVVSANDVIEETTDVETTTVHVTGRLTVNPSNTLTTTNLILEGTPTSSGEIVGNVAASQKAYFDFSNGTEGFKARTWYAVAVPWQVEVPAYDKDHNGVYLTNDGVSYTQQELGRSFDLIYYNGARRASEGHSDACWQYIEDDAADKHIMYPGRAYMIYLTSNAQTIRFERKAETPLQTNTLAVATYDLGTGNNKDANWNGIANPATYHAYINANVKDYASGTMNVGQVYNAETRTYSVVNMSTNNLVVGQPIFVQAIATNESVVAYAAHDDAFHAAPRRSKAWTAPLTRYELMLAADDADVTDRVIVRMNEDKEEDAYIVGQDLVKMGVSSIVPQMWINRYDSKMCINTVAGFEHTADYPLGIFAPKDGDYDLFIDDQPNDETMLYLTYDGEAIWNLSYGGYVTYLTKGTDTHYGLRIVARKPQITTGIEETTIQNGDPIRKVMVDGKVYIIRNGEIYSVTGQKTK